MLNLVHLKVLAAVGRHGSVTEAARELVDVALVFRYAHAPLEDDGFRIFPTEAHRRKALPSWLHEHNDHRAHTAIGRQPPISRLTNLPGQYN